jgi:hypothetical protein
MADIEMYLCTVCGRQIQSTGWQGHARSNAHIEAGGDESSFVPVADNETAPVAEAFTGLAPSELAEILDENASLKEQLIRLEKERARLDPLSQWPVWESVEQVREWLGDAHCRLIGEVELAAENKARQKQGLPPLYSSDPDQYERLVAQSSARSIRRMVDEQAAWTAGVAEGKHKKMRTFKMVAPARSCEYDGEASCYRHGSMRQIPVELQINNGSASLNDPIERYKRKGFKPAAPIRCKLVDCYRAAAVTNGEWTFAMYCSMEHHNYVEGSTQTSKAGNLMTVYEPTLA